MFIAPLPVYAFGIDDIIEQNTKHAWYAGKGISPGDSFEYLVCDNTRHHIDEGGCHHMRLDFYIELESQNRDVWIVQANVTGDEGTGLHIFLIDSDTLQVSTDRATDALAGSLENTVFYLSQFTHSQLSKQLRVGSIWAEVPSTIELGSKLIVIAEDTIQIENGNILNVFVLRYGLFESSIFTVSPDLPFPVSAVAYDPSYITSNPPVLFTFELLDYHTEMSGIGQGSAKNGPKTAIQPS